MDLIQLSGIGLIEDRKTMRKIELLAPARDLTTGIAAIEYGADALYVGGPKFGARGAATNSIDEIEALVEYAQPFGVRIYAALNTIIYEEELNEAQALAQSLIDVGIDALIIQDLAFTRMVKGVELHASTQMFNTTPEWVKFLEKSGFSRVILERGLSMAEIAQIRAKCEVSLECFIHGAICVGYSGRCYLSRSMGARSGNRGECGQPCRLTYDLVRKDGQVVMAGKHLLSVEDMNLSRRIPELIDLGVDSFKIEGRLKGVEYVKNTVAHYRREIDRAIKGMDPLQQRFMRASSGYSMVDFEPDPSKTFTRRAGEWMVDGRRSGVASFETPKAMGSFVGEVGRVEQDSFQLKGNEELSAGDGVCFMVDRELVGSSINIVEGRTIYPNRMDGIRSGLKIYRNYDHRFTLALQQSKTRRVIDALVKITLGLSRVEIVVEDSDGQVSRIEMAGEYQVANNREKMVDTVRRQMAKSGDTIFNIVGVEVALADGDQMPFMPISELNELRREVLDKLLNMRRKRAIEALRAKRVPEEDRSYPCPDRELDAESNVVNSLADSFYRDHGVESIVAGADLNSSFVGQSVLRSPYCIRREIGECPKLNRGAIPIGEILLLRRGRESYRLDFDCERCEMTLRKGL